MRPIGENGRMRALAMARGKSPWGGKGKGAAGEAESAEGKADSGDPAAQPGAPDVQPDSGNGPRNPWLPEGNEAEGRRSPKIEEILRQRGGGSDGGGGFPNFPGAGQARTLIPWFAAGAVVLLALSTSVQMLEPGQQGIVSTLGRYNRTIGQGFNLTLPWPLETVTVRGEGGSVVTSLPSADSDPSLLTRDGELIEVNADLRWRIADARAFSGAFADADATIARLAQAEVRAGVAELPFDDLWNGSRQKELEDRVAARIQRALGAMRAGVTVEGLAITRASPPASLAEAFEKVGNEREKANKLRLESEKWGQQLVSNAQSEAASFNRVYEQYKLAPEVVRRRMYYQTIERILKNNERVIVGGSGAAGDIAAQGAK